MSPDSHPVDRVFAELRRQGRKAFIPFVTAGDPDVAFTADLLRDHAEVGASIVEVGFPFSDPIADGPVIQASYTRALDRGVRLDDVFTCVRSVTSRPGWTVPVVGMVSYSIVFRRGVEAFLDRAAESRFAALIVPDLPAEEAEEFARLAAARGIKLVLLVTPTTSPARAERIARLSSGFLYCVSVVGITGERDRLPEALREQMRNLRATTDLPLCVGFGVSRPEHARELRDVADGVIVGSALVRWIEEVPARGREEVRRAIRETAERLVAALASDPG